MSMFDLFDSDKKYPGWNRLILSFYLLLIFLPFGHFLFQASVIFDEKVAPLTVMRQNWFDFVFLILGFVGVCFVEKTDHIVNKALRIILFFKSRKGKRIILFSLSVIFWILSIFAVYSIEGNFFRNFYQLGFGDLFVLFGLFVPIITSTNIMVFAVLSCDDILFKKLW